MTQMDKHEVAKILDEMAVFYELKGENPFKVRAYENATRIIEGLTYDIATLVAKNELTSIKGIGKNLAEHIAEIVKTGKLKTHEELRASIPDGVIQMLSIPGLGPKRVRYIWENRGVKSIAELEMGCKRHLFENAPGFGDKLVKKILDGIAMLKRFADKRLFADAFFQANEIHSKIKKFENVIRSDIAGSVRRRKEIIGDIDILVSTDKPKNILERFVTLPDVERVIQYGETKAEVILKSGIQCDLRVVTDSEYPFALHYFTGSKEHNIAMRSIAKKRGLKLSEYGLFKEGQNKSIACKDEKELFEAFDLSFIEPELRENTGEIEAAAEGNLPKLVELKNLNGIIHAHSNYTDGDSTIAEMADAAKSLGYNYIAICDHSKAVTVANGMKPATIKKQHKEIDSLNDKSKNFRILKGIEVDILADGSLDFDDELLATFDIVVAAIHSRFGMGEAEMTNRILRAVANPNVDILAHPTGRLLLARDGYKVDLKKVIDECAKHGTAIEINAHPQRLDLDWRWCKYAKEQGVKFAICPDAHASEEIDNVTYGINIARKGWLEKKDIINCLNAKDLLETIK